MTESGVQCVMMTIMITIMIIIIITGIMIMTQQRMSFARCSDWGRGVKLVTATTEPITDKSGWTMCDAVVGREILPSVHTATGAFMIVVTMKTSLSPVFRLKLG